MTSANQTRSVYSRPRGTKFSPRPEVVTSLVRSFERRELESTNPSVVPEETETKGSDDESQTFLNQLQAYFQRGQIQPAELYFKQLTHKDHFVATTDMFNVMLKLYASQEKTRKIKETLTLMEESKLKPNTTTYEILIEYNKTNNQSPRRAEGL